MKHAVKHIHFVGIGGIGMSGIRVRVNASPEVTLATLRRLMRRQHRQTFDCQHRRWLSFAPCFCRILRRVFVCG